MPSKKVIAAVATAAVVGGCAVAVGSNSSTTTSASGSGNKSGTKQAVGIGTPVRDGKFEFTVNKVSCGKDQVGESMFGKTAQGQFCFVSVTVQNVGEKAQTMFGDNQKLYDAQGRQFSADTEAAIYKADSKTLFEEINPGNSVDGTVIFDVPKGTQPTKIELHDSMFSGGVTVNLA